MTNRPNALQAVLSAAALNQPGAVQPAAPSAPRARATPSAPAKEDKGKARHQRPSREGKRLIAGHFTPEQAKQLKLIAVEDGVTVQEALEEALNLLFSKKGKKTFKRV
jgi:hypothetical protein